MDYQALQTELAGSHPISGAYNADAALAAAQINALDIVRIRASMSGQELLEATDSTEFGALSDAKKSQWLALTGHDAVNPEAGGVAQEIVVDIFGGGSTTVTALGTLRQETVSRGVDLGFGYVTPGDVEFARAL